MSTCLCRVTGQSCFREQGISIPMPPTQIIMMNYIISSESHTPADGVHNQESVQRSPDTLPDRGLGLGTRLVIKVLLGGCGEFRLLIQLFQYYYFSCSGII